MIFNRKMVARDIGINGFFQFFIPKPYLKPALATDASVHMLFKYVAGLPTTVQPPLDNASLSHQM